MIFFMGLSSSKRNNHLENAGWLPNKTQFSRRVFPSHLFSSWCEWKGSERFKARMGDLQILSHNRERLGAWNPNDPCFLLEKGLILGGWPSKLEVIGVPGASPIGFDQHILGDCGLFFFRVVAVVRKHDEFVKQPYLTRWRWGKNRLILRKWLSFVQIWCWFFFGNSPAEPSSTCFFSLNGQSHQVRALHELTGEVWNMAFLSVAFTNNLRKMLQKKNMKKTDRLFWARDLAETARCFKITSRKRCPPKKRNDLRQFCVCDLLFGMVKSCWWPRWPPKKHPFGFENTKRVWRYTPKTYPWPIETRQVFGRLSLPVTNRPSPEK